MPDSGPEIGRRRFRVGERQPALQRNQAHLHREADEQAGDDRCAGERRDHGGLVGDRRELERADLGVRQQDAEIHQIGARRAHQEVDEAGAQRLGRLFVDDQEVRGPGHQLPEDIEVAELVRRRDADQRAGHQEGEEVVAIGGGGAADVADRIDDHQAADAGEQQREQSRGRVEPAVEARRRRRSRSPAGRRRHRVLAPKRGR